MCLITFVVLVRCSLIDRSMLCCIIVYSITICCIIVNCSVVHRLAADYIAVYGSTLECIIVDCMMVDCSTVY